MTTGGPSEGTSPLPDDDLAGVGLDPRTEAILTTDETDAIATAFARWLGVGRRGVIVFPFTSLQPVPRPRLATADGRRRLPPGITAEGSRHPAWWLDAHTAWQDPDEDDLAYGVRLVLELERRGVAVPGDGPLDALASGLGWVLGDPVTDARVAAYAAGGWDPALCRFELRPRPVAGLTGSRADLQHRARQLLGPRLRLIEVLASRRAATVARTLQAERTLLDREEADLDGRVAAVRRWSAQLRHQARHGDERERLLIDRQGLATAVESVIDAMEDLHQLCWRHGGRHVDPEDRRTRHRQAAALMGAVYASPAADSPHQALHLRLDVWRQAASQSAVAARRAIDEHLRSSPDDDSPAVMANRPVEARAFLGAVGSVAPFPG
jgi:hypothetical protein